jgi:uncharacterized membrane protein YccF (DUF307 family)
MTMSFILNLIWVVFGGFVMGCAWLLAGLIAALSIVGLPWARACFSIASFSFWPFGREAVNRAAFYGRADIGTGPLGAIGNIIWFIFLGVWLAIGHAVSAVACAITIIGIPFAIQHLKLAQISLMPIGMTIVDKQDVLRRGW